MLKYIGNSWIPGIPARDIGEAELQELAERLDRSDLVEVLVNSGLYEPVENAKINRAQRADKSLRPETENKAGG
jgi:hypothetical protein